MVAERDRIGTDREQPLGELGCDPDAVGDVLAVDDAEVDAELVAETGQPFLQRLSAGSADDVADEEDPQRGPPLRNEPAAGKTSIATLLPRERACFASAWRSTAATSTTEPSFDDDASTGAPTAREGSGRGG